MGDTERIILSKPQVTSVIGIDPGTTNLGFVFMERISEKNREGFRVKARFTKTIGNAEDAKGTMVEYWANKVAEFVKLNRESWFDRASVVAIERQFVPPNATGRLVSFYIQLFLVSTLTTLYGPDKICLIGANQIKAKAFKFEERESYATRKKAAVNMCTPELLKASQFDGEIDDHQADACLVAWFYVNHVLPQPQIRNKELPKPGRPKKIEDESLEVPASEEGESTEEYVPTKITKRGRKVKKRRVSQDE